MRTVIIFAVLRVTLMDESILFRLNTDKPTPFLTINKGHAMYGVAEVRVEPGRVSYDLAYPAKPGEFIEYYYFK